MASSSLEALLLVAPSPPVPMTVPEEQRKQMIEAYCTREGVEALIQHVLTAVPIPQGLREIIIEDTLRGAPQAKRAWPEVGIIEDFSPAVQNAYSCAVSSPAKDYRELHLCHPPSERPKRI